MRRELLDEAKGAWTARAVCRGPDGGEYTHLFYEPQYYERKDERTRREAAAKALCAVCPVLQECREYAVAIREPFGIWGGMTDKERKALYR